MKMITITSNVEVRADRIESVKTETYKNAFYDEWRVNVKVFLVSGSYVEDNVTFGAGKEYEEAAYEWCDIVKSDIYRAVEKC